MTTDHALTRGPVETYPIWGQTGKLCQARFAKTREECEDTLRPRVPAARSSIVDDKSGINGRRQVRASAGKTGKYAINVSAISTSTGAQPAPEALRVSLVARREQLLQLIESTVFFAIEHRGNRRHRSISKDFARRAEIAMRAKGNLSSRRVYRDMFIGPEKVAGVQASLEEIVALEDGLVAAIPTWGPPEVQDDCPIVTATDGSSAPQITPWPR